MKRTALLFVMMLVATSFVKTKAQSVADFEKDLNQTAAANFPQVAIDTLFKRYNHILFWFNDNSRLAASLKGYENLPPFPLESIREKGVYRDHIDALLADTAWGRQSLGYFLAGAANDTAKSEKIKEILVNSGYRNFWAATILTYLNRKDLDPILKCLNVYRESNSVGYLINDLMRMDGKLLDQLGRDSLASKDSAVQYLAIRCLVVMPIDPAKENLLRAYVKNADAVMKGWGIAALAKFHASDMATLVRPFLSHTDPRGISLKALAASTDLNDIALMDQIAANQAPDRDFLDALLSSENEHHIKSWYGLIRSGRVDSDYFIHIRDNPFALADVHFDDVCAIISNGKAEMQVYALMKYFESRKDEKTITFLKECLNHTTGEVRRQAKEILKRINGTP